MSDRTKEEDVVIHILPISIKLNDGGTVFEKGLFTAGELWSIQHIRYMP
jgi:hypothetical protein